MAESFFSQLKSLLESGEQSADFVNPSDESQTIEVNIRPVPDRPEGWPETLLEPLVIENDNLSGIAYVIGDNGDTYLMFHDPENAGQYLAVEQTQVSELYRHYFLPTSNEIPQERLDDVEFSEAVITYSDTVNAFRQTGVTFGAGIMLDEIAVDGVIDIRQTLEIPEPTVQDLTATAEVPLAPSEIERDARRGEPDVDAFGGIGEVAEAAVEDGNTVLSAQEFFDQRIGGVDTHLEAMGAISRDAIYQANTVLNRIEVEFRKSSDLSDPDVQEQIAFMFGNIPDEWKAPIAGYIQERIDSGEPLGRTTVYGTAINALVEGDVARAQGLLQFGIVEGAPSIQTDVVTPGVPEIEPSVGEITASEVSPGQIMLVENVLATGVSLFDGIRAEAAVEIAEAEAIIGALQEAGVDPNSDVLRGQLERVEELNSGLEYATQRHLGSAIHTSLEIMKVDTNFAGVISGDPMDLSTIVIDLDQLPAEYEALRDELMAMNERIVEIQSQNTPDVAPAVP